jgi:hypothetical protein
MERCVETMQPLKALRLWWKNAGQDVRLGTGFHQDIPPKGSLLVFSCDHGVVWRVTELYFGLVAEGSMTWQAWRDGRPHEGGALDVFVEPAEGPFVP